MGAVLDMVENQAIQVREEGVVYNLKGQDTDQDARGYVT